MNSAPGYDEHGVRLSLNAVAVKLAQLLFNIATYSDARMRLVHADACAQAARKPKSHFGAAPVRPMTQGRSVMSQHRDAGNKPYELLALITRCAVLHQWLTDKA